MATTSYGGVKREKLIMDSLVCELLKIGNPIDKVDWVLDMMSFGYKLRVLFTIEGEPYTWQKLIPESHLKETVIMRGIYDDAKACIQAKINEVYSNEEEQEDSFKNVYRSLRVYGYADVSGLHRGI